MSKVHDDDDDDNNDHHHVDDGTEEEVKIRRKRLWSVSCCRTVYLVAGGS